MPNYRRALLRFVFASCAGMVAGALTGTAIDKPTNLAITIVATARAQSHSDGNHGGAGQTGGKHIGGAIRAGKKGGSQGKHGTGGHDDGHEDSEHSKGAGKKGGKPGGKHSGGKHIDHEHTSAELTGGSDIEENVFRHSGGPTGEISRGDGHDEEAQGDEDGHSSAL